MPITSMQPHRRRSRQKCSLLPRSLSFYALLCILAVSCTRIHAMCHCKEVCPSYEGFWKLQLHCPTQGFQKCVNTTDGTHTDTKCREWGLCNGGWMRLQHLWMQLRGVRMPQQRGRPSPAAAATAAAPPFAGITRVHRHVRRLQLVHDLVTRRAKGLPNGPVLWHGRRIESRRHPRRPGSLGRPCRCQSERGADLRRIQPRRPHRSRPFDPLRNRDGRR